jgi:hypothetical protein
VLTGRRNGGRCSSGCPARRIRPALGSSKPAIRRKKRGLAAAGGAQQGEELVAGDGEADLVERQHRSLAVPEPLADLVDLDRGRIPFRHALAPHPCRAQ